MKYYRLPTKESIKNSKYRILEGNRFTDVYEKGTGNYVGYVKNTMFGTTVKNLLDKDAVISFDGGTLLKEFMEEEWDE